MSLIDEYLAYLRVGKKSPKTIRARENFLRGIDYDLIEMFGLGIEEVSDGEIVAWMDTYGRRWKPWTASTYYNHLNSFYKWATRGRDPRLLFNPCDDIDRPPTPKDVAEPATTEDISIALAMSTGQWRTIVLLATYGSLRCADIYWLDRGDVSLAGIRIRNGKGGKQAILPCHDLIWDAVEPLSPGWVVRDPRPSSPEALSRDAGRYFRRLGLPKLHLHAMRHWYATGLLLGGVDIRAVQTLMRHAKLETTAGYLHVTEGQRRDAITALPLLTSPSSKAPAA